MSAAVSPGRSFAPAERRRADLSECQLHLYAHELYSYASMTRSAVLALEDGSAWWGEAFGDGSAASGEVVFNTAMTGYQEIASDASYNGQIVVLTYPLIGNYGTFDRAAESRRPWVEALLVRELVSTCREGTIDLDAYLRSYGVPGLAGIDTRALVRRLRAKGTLRGAILQVPPHRSQDPDIAREAVAKAQASAPLAAKPLVVEASRPLPILGICLGHQLVARAIGASTSRLPFGHHGANHPVQDLRTGKVAITSQNHEFQVDESSIPSDSGFVVSSRNLNDGSVEGLVHEMLPIRTFQYHPEGAPGPRDNVPA